LESVTETKGYGQKGPTEFYRRAEFTAKFRTMVKIEVAVTAHQVRSSCGDYPSRREDWPNVRREDFVSQLDQVWNIRSDTEAAVPPLAA
jgi:nitrogen regulatory protein PII